MGTLLRSEEYQFFEELKQKRVLKRFHPDNVHLNGSVLAALFCGDSDHSEDKFTYLGRLTSQRHLLTANGGGHLLDDRYCLRKFGREAGPVIHRFWMEQFLETQELKKPSLNITKAHYRCGAATVKCGYTASESINSAVRGALRLSQQFDQCKFVSSTGQPVKVGREPLVLALFHISNGERKSWLIDVRHDRFAPIWKEVGIARR